MDFSPSCGIPGGSKILVSISILQGKSKLGEVSEGLEESQRESGLAGMAQEFPQAKGRDLSASHPCQS